MNWHDLLPKALALEQISWERRRAARRMRTLGLTYKEIGRRLGINGGRAAQLAADRWHRQASPAQRWLCATWERADLNQYLTLADVAKQR